MTTSSSMTATRRAAPCWPASVAAPCLPPLKPRPARYQPCIPVQEMGGCLGGSRVTMDHIISEGVWGAVNEGVGGLGGAGFMAMGLGGQ